MNYKNIAKLSRASQEWFELWKMLEAVADIKPKRILEIGVFRGYSAETWRKAFPDALVIGIDNSPHTIDFSDFTFIEGDSFDYETAARAKDYGPYDFLFIDGDHTYNGVTTDFNLYYPLVRPGGIIGFHDTNSRGIQGVEVDQFLKELDEKMSFQYAEFRASRMSPGTRLIWKESL